MSDAVESDYLNYPTFNDFFTRALKPSSRPITKDQKIIVSPVDGKVWQIGTVDNNHINAKGKNFTLEQLIADNKDAFLFHRANFAVLYLAPYNYHRIHMPIKGRLCSMRHIPGTLFSVNPNIAKYMPDVFAKNERVVSIFNTALGKMGIIFVGALFVGSIETKWAGLITPNKQKNITNWNYNGQDIIFNQGIEIGSFKMGSTVILLFPEKTITWDKHLQLGTIIKMGQGLGMLL